MVDVGSDHIFLQEGNPSSLLVDPQARCVYEETSSDSEESSSHYRDSKEGRSSHYRDSEEGRKRSIDYGSDSQKSKSYRSQSEEGTIQTYNPDWEELSPDWKELLNDFFKPPPSPPQDPSEQEGYQNPPMESIPEVWPLISY